MNTAASSTKQCYNVRSRNETSSLFSLSLRPQKTIVIIANTRTKHCIWSI